MKLIQKEYLKAVKCEYIHIDDITADGLQVVTAEGDVYIGGRYIALTSCDDYAYIDAIYDRLSNCIFLTSLQYDLSNIEIFKDWLHEHGSNVALLAFY